MLKLLVWGHTLRTTEKLKNDKSDYDIIKFTLKKPAGAVVLYLGCTSTEAREGKLSIFKACR